jgi:phosphohistidine phosphatase
MTASSSARDRSERERCLILLRHAKSSWGDSSLGDHERPLNARGQHAGRLLADFFARSEAPDLVLCSDSVRTRQTLEHISPAFAKPPRVSFERALYLADAPALLARIAGVPDEVGTLLVIAHNPGMHELAAALAATSPKRVRKALDHKYPTGAVACYRFTGAWHDIGQTPIALAQFTTPADLAASEEDDPD